MRVLVTRPAVDGERTAAALRGRGHEVLLAPLLRIEPIADAEIGAGPWRALAFTSANAVEALLARKWADLLRLPAFTVGERSAAAARAAGLAEVHSARGDVAALARLLAAHFGSLANRGAIASGDSPPPERESESEGERRKGPILYLAAEERAGDLAGLLAPTGLPVDTVPIYRAVAAKTLPATIRAALATGAIDAVLHYSRRTAETFVAAIAAGHVRMEGLALRHLCLSADVAAPLRAAGAERIAIAQQPNQHALLALLEPSADCCDHA